MFNMFIGTSRRFSDIQKKLFEGFKANLLAEKSIVMS